MKVSSSFISAESSNNSVPSTDADVKKCLNTDGNTGVNENDIINALNPYIKSNPENFSIIFKELIEKDGFAIIRRVFVKKDTSLSSENDKQNPKSEFYLQDKKVSARLINILVKGLGVQCDNLCQFLPQDRVSEFARLSPSELFGETLKTCNKRFEHSPYVVPLMNI